MNKPIKAPMPYFGGKAAVAHEVWQRFGNVPNFVDPFFGSGAVLFGRPSEPGIETVNDKDGFVANLFRAIANDPDAVADAANWPVNENDLHARHAWLVGQRAGLTARLEGDPNFYDTKIAGWWVWGICSWIGSGWCSGNGPWVVVDGRLVKSDDAGQGINRQLPHIGFRQGINRKLPHIGFRQGINRQQHLESYFQEIAERLRTVRVCCGDWTRVLGSSPTEKLGLTGIFLDPPYSLEADRAMSLYAVDCGSVAHDVREWAIANGDNPMLRIALCGYEGEHSMPSKWAAHAWKARGGYGSQGENTRGRANASREVIWFSPHCLNANQASLFAEVA